VGDQNEEVLVFSLSCLGIVVHFFDVLHLAFAEAQTRLMVVEWYSHGRRRVVLLEVPAEDNSMRISITSFCPTIGILQ
jgi:hypothetical protein